MISDGVPRMVRIGLAKATPVRVSRQEAASRMYTEFAIPLRTDLPSPAPKCWDITIPIPADNPKKREKQQIDHGGAEHAI